MPQLFFRPQYVWFPVHLKGHLIPLCYETLVVNWQNWLFTLFHQSRSVLSPNPIVRVSHWPIIWPIYLPCTVAQGQSHCASNIISNSHPFQVSRPPQSWDTAISKFDLENPRSRSWVRSKFEVKTWVQHSIDSHPFQTMSIGYPIPEIRLFQNLTLKIQGQGDGWGPRSEILPQDSSPPSLRAVTGLAGENH